MGSVTTQVDLGSASVTDYSNISYKVDAETGEFEAIVMYSE
ncbi:hypothetical protein [Lysinibacillus xylanilyticus]|nr:hypothetical protein [Lysinibacillus xylanilyticus]